jgi:hypothetical protein
MAPVGLELRDLNDTKFFLKCGAYSLHLCQDGP